MRTIISLFWIGFLIWAALMIFNLISGLIMVVLVGIGSAFYQLLKFLRIVK